MSSRRYSLPLATIGLSLGAACTDPLVGDWELTEADGQEWPRNETYTYDGYSVSYKAEAMLTVEKDLSASMEVEVSAEIEGGDSYHETYVFEGEATPGEDRGDYAIELEGDEDEIDLTCTLEDDQLSCEDDDGVDFEFTRMADK